MMMELLAWLGSSLHTILFFVLALSALVSVHEYGHFWVARRCGVAIEVFSIGFGRELLGWTDRRGTRWKISLLPLGGYVKFLGDSDGTSTRGDLDAVPEARRADTYHAKPVAARAAIAAAGPVANFIFAVLLFAALFATFGQPFTPAEVGKVVAGGAAEAAGLKPGDRIVAIDGGGIDRFEDLQLVIRLNQGTPIDLRFLRDGQVQDIAITPKVVDEDDGNGRTVKVGQLGISRSGTEYVQRGPLDAVWYGAREVWTVIDMTGTALGQMVTGSRSTEDLGGPLGIATMAGRSASLGFASFLWLVAALSVNLALFNLLPVPMLDGGHLLFYACEAMRGRPLGERVQEFGFRIGLAMVLTLMVFATWNDLVRLRVVDFISGLFT